VLLSIEADRTISHFNCYCECVKFTEYQQSQISFTCLHYIDRMSFLL